MEKIEIDFIMVIDESNRVTSFKIIDSETFRAFDELLSNQIGVAIDSFFSINLTKKN